MHLESKLLRPFLALSMAALAACTGGESTQNQEPAATPAVTAAASGPTLAAAIGQINQQDFAGAEATLRQVIEAQPDNVRAYLYLGSACRGQEKFDDALAAFEKAAEIDPSNTNGVYGQASVYALRHEADQAFELLDQLRGKHNMTGISLDDNFANLRGDARLAALMPTPEEFADPFVEETRIIHEWDGEAAGDQFGWIARNAGDVDGDGVADVVTSAPTAGEDDRGRIYLYSGKGGKLLWQFDGRPGDQLGTGVETAGDVNADGVPDVAAGGGPGNRAVVLSGTDGSILLELQPSQEAERFGRHVKGIGDVDGDGHSDVLVGAPGNNKAAEGAGRVGLYSGKDGSLLREWLGEEAGDRMGETIAGKVVGDTAWILLGAPDAGEGDRGRVYVYNGMDENPRFVIDSDEKGAQLGAMFISVVGDVDGDGTPDVYASDWAHTALGPQTGQVVVHSGATGQQLAKLTGDKAREGFGIGIGNAGDVDGDGHDDLIIGAWQHASAAPSGGKTFLYSGKDFSLMRTWTGKVPGETFGFDTTNVGDVDGDGKIDFLLTSAWSAKNGPQSGRMFIIAG